ncbi:MAG: XdhC/CoxI family protein [Deltaproteobacteria bacterium]|jgi:xanthine dehydrogenase accessory factor|nr:XdhC/CoxI family protein [Deltaproteobacteria bacterium]
MSDFYEEILEIKSAGRKAAVATIVGTKGSTPREVGAKMLIHEDGKILGTIGGGCMEAEVWQEAMKVIAEDKPKTIHFDLTGRAAEESGMICGGVMDIYIEPIVPTPRVFIFGGGHISLFVSKMSTMVGFQVVVIDDRPQFANQERFPEAEEVIAEEFPFVLPKLQVNRSTYLVIVTRGHAYDQEVLEWALSKEVKYIGMIGSRKKIQTVYNNLKEKGFTPDQLQRVHAPIGLDIGALTPEEIAVSIVAEMIKVHRERKGEK